MNDLELDAVGVVEEARVVPRHVRPHPWVVLDAESPLSRPAQTRVDCLPGRGLERDVVNTRRVAVMCLRRLCLTQAYGDATRARHIHDAFVALADDLPAAFVPEHRQQLLIKRKASFERGHDEVEVVDAYPHAVSRRLPTDDFAHERQDVVRVGITADHLLLEDELAVDVHVEDAVRSGHDLDRAELVLFPLLEQSRHQTGGVRPRPSGDAVLDADVMPLGHRVIVSDPGD